MSLLLLGGLAKCFFHGANYKKELDNILFGTYLDIDNKELNS